MSVISELKRRNVFRVAALYVIAAWLILQVAGLLFDLLELPAWAGKSILGLLLLGFPLVVLFSWIYELTPEGLKKQHEVDRAASITHETGRKLNVAIGVLAVLAILTVAADRLIPRNVPQAATGAPTQGSSAAVTGAADRSIAVLPFVNMSADKDQEYFTDGISEELLNLLAKLPELKVIGRTSSFQFKGKNEDLRVIGQKLNVAHILEGSVRKSGDKIRLTAQLIRADDGSHLWSETYDRQLDDIFAVQDEIAREVVRALKITLLGDALPVTARTRDSESHSLYLQGRFFADRRGPGDLRKSIEYFEQALERDPNFAAAWVELSAARTNNAQTMGVDMAAQLQKAREEARRAVQVDPQLPDGYAAMAYDSMMLDWDWQEASRLLARARELDPNNLRTLRMTAHLAGTLGHFDEAIPLHGQVVAREPLVVSHYANMALVLRNAGKLSEAEQALRKAIELSPDAGGVHSMLSGIQVLRGEPAAALESLERETDEIWKALALPIVLQALGRPADSEQALKSLENELATTAAFQIAEAHAFRGDSEKALKWLRRAYENRDGGLTEIKGDPWLKSLEGDPRYLEIVRRIGLDQVSFRAAWVQRLDPGKLPPKIRQRG